MRCRDLFSGQTCQPHVMRFVSSPGNKCPIEFGRPCLPSPIPLKAHVGFSVLLFLYNTTGCVRVGARPFEMRCRDGSLLRVRHQAEQSSSTVERGNVISSTLSCGFMGHAHRRDNLKSSSCWHGQVCSPGADVLLRRFSATGSQTSAMLNHVCMYLHHHVPKRTQVPNIQPNCVRRPNLRQRKPTYSQRLQAWKRK